MWYLDNTTIYWNPSASSHDGDLRIWDQRKGTTPVNYITAHLAKIHGVDWSPSSESKLATSSQDCTVKFWDLTNPKRAVDQLTTGSPVWRARYTPFGSGRYKLTPWMEHGGHTYSLEYDQWPCDIVVTSSQFSRLHSCIHMKLCSINPSLWLHQVW